MAGIRVTNTARKVTIFGHGLQVNKPFEFEPGTIITSDIPKLDLDTTVSGCASFSDYAAAIHGHPMATFGIEIHEPLGGEELTVRGWNSFWIFHLLSVAKAAPCLILYSMCDGDKPTYSACSSTPILNGFENIALIDENELAWAQTHKEAFDKLIHVSEFSTAMRCYSNSFYLWDKNIRIMLLWAGIEGLLSVDAELSRRVALSAAILLNGSADAKGEFYDFVKGAYGVRSRAVHGSAVKPDKLAKGCEDAAHILATLLARCVELGRVPTPSELDRLAVTASVE